MTVSNHTATVNDAAVKAAALALRYSGDTLTDMAKTALTAALPHLALSSAPCSVEVEKLKWFTAMPFSRNPDCKQYAETPFGRLQIYNENGYQQGFRVKIPFQVDNLLGDEKFIHPEQAKAAAQIDFDRRILSQIVTKPVDVAEVREQALKEAMQAIADLPVNPDDGITMGYEDSYRAVQSIPYVTTKLAGNLPQDVINLVIAARDFAYGGHIDVASKEFDVLDKALEAFAARIDWDDHPEDSIRALSPAEPAQGEQWQDIASAPKDGTFFITVNTGEIERWHTFKDGEIISVKANDRPFMCSSFSDEDGTPLFMDDFGEAYTLDGIVIDADELTAADNVLRLTHWMPLPAAPNLSSGRTTEGGEA